jgi:hypothetical protein
MKNLFLLPTDKPSRLFKFANELHLDTIPKEYYKKYQLYITSDEEIKEGDWMIRGNEQPIKVTKDFFWDFGVRYYKIILTTDLSLDGVQAIDDYFLEWFVENPSCENVEVDCWNIRTKNKVVYEPSLKEYEIIIPQEESKEETNDSSLKLLQVLELVELALQNGSIHPGSFIIRNAVRECIGLEPIK